jgi:CelD/BcsL family acetyltransferase involved in cellulose biosynthesis
MRVTTCLGRDALERCATAYDELAAAAGVPVTGSRRWLQTWVDCYPDWDPWVVLVEDGTAALAAAPLARRRRGPATQVVGLGHGPSDLLRLPAVDDGAAAALATHLAAALTPQGPWTLRLDQLAAGEAVGEALATLLPLARQTPGDGLPLLRVDPRRDPALHLSRNTRQAVRAAVSRLERAGHEVEQRWTEDSADIEQALPEIARVHRARSEAQAQAIDHDDPRAEAFHREVIARHALAGCVHLFTLRVDGDLAAFVVGIRDGDTLRVWNNRLNPAWAHASAGRVANAAAVRLVVEDRRFAALDWMRGEEAYKLSSATDMVPTVQLRAWSSRAARMPAQAGTVARRARDRSPALAAVVARLRRT